MPAQLTPTPVGSRSRVDLREGGQARFVILAPRRLAPGRPLHGAMDPGSHLQEAVVPIKFWSPIGD
jgi:hypothetical protein